MTCTVNTTIRPEHYIITYYNPTAINKYRIEVRKEILTDRYVESVVTIEGCAYLIL